MELIISTAEEYKNIFPSPYHIFNDANFAKINEAKCEEVVYLLFKDKKYRLGLTAGIRNNILHSPFSAPFGGFSLQKEDIQISTIENAEKLLTQFCRDKKLSGIKLLLPPIFYAETFLAKYLNVLYRHGYQTTNLDLDFYINLKNTSDYENSIWYNAKKNLRIANNNNLTFEKVGTEELELVYEIIKQNRAFKGKPFNMSIDDIKATMNIIPTDLFLTKHNDTAIASAIVFRVNSHILYIPFWADLPGNLELKPMNLLSAKIFEFYRDKGDSYVHIGISTENSVPNYGLCDFKESIGCTITPKFMFMKQINTSEK